MNQLPENSLCIYDITLVIYDITLVTSYLKCIPRVLGYFC